MQIYCRFCRNCLPNLRDRKSTRLKSSHTVRSTLFAYTTLFRSHEGQFLRDYTKSKSEFQEKYANLLPVLPELSSQPQRSEEHTSEIQSHSEIYTLCLHDALPIS